MLTQGPLTVAIWLWIFPRRQCLPTLGAYQRSGTFKRIKTKQADLRPSPLFMEQSRKLTALTLVSFHINRRNHAQEHENNDDKKHCIIAPERTRNKEPPEHNKERKHTENAAYD